MNNRPPRLTGSPALPVAELRRAAEGWLISGEIDQHSERTLDARRDILNKFLWFCNQKGIESCDTDALRGFLAYLTHGHKEPGGRWGNPAMTRPVRPRTVHTYHGHLRTLFRWLVAEGILDVSPMERIPAPTARADQIQPFSAEEFQRLIEAAKKSRYAARDQAILWLLVDTGMRSSEICHLTVADVDLIARRVTVLGKGNKRRLVYFHKTAHRALWNYLQRNPRAQDEPLFLSERGEALTRSGLQQMITRLGIDARLQNVRCSPHTFRHTFAVNFLRAGGNTFALQQLLGHTNLQMTQRYVALAQADMEQQHRSHSPAEFLRMKSRS